MMRSHASVKLMVLLALVAPTALAAACELEPADGQRRTGKAPGDNHYKILISGDPERYAPGELYTVTLVGSRTHDRLQQFTRFQLVARPLKPDTPVSPQHQGQFQLFADTLTTFSERCINTVLEADDLPKTEVQVMWKAPARGSGCVNIQAMVQEDEWRWFAEDGQLTRRVCEQTAHPESPDSCCACDEAKYSLVFQGLWRKETHPKDFPTSLWLMHFSDLIGASHEPNFTFWGEGEIATDGFRSLAEWGSTGLLEQELKQRGAHLRTLVKAAGLWHPRVNANTSGTFVVDRRRPELSLASMLGPTPDWVVGVNGLNLCLKDCSWIERKTVDLYPYDAGTDNGISYMSPNAETVPREKMYRISTMYPEDPRAPFYEPGRAEMAPLARLYLTREKIIPKGCDEELLQKLVVEVAENTEDTSRPECATGAWSAWSACSVPCGKGLRMRTRAYLAAAAERDCDRQLVGKEMCVAAVPECPEEGGSEQRVEDTSGECGTAAWGAWAACSETCGAGVRMRSRTFLQPSARKKCSLVNLVEKEKCMEPECDPSEVERPDAECPSTPWSDWSPCSATCGRGLELRTRLLLVEPARQLECAARLTLLQQRPCLLKEDCTFDMVTAKRVCMQPPEVGPCRSDFLRWTFNAQKLMCTPFTYGGCKGNQNNFLSQGECTKACQVVIDLARGNQAVEPVSSPTVGGRALVGGDEPLPREHAPPLPATADRVDCQHGPWSDWSPCSVSCGRGFQEKTRPIIVEAQNGGIPCPSRLARRRRCYQRCY